MWQDEDGVLSDGGGVVRAAALTVAGSERGTVTLTGRAPEPHLSAIECVGANAMLLLNPDEARGFAAWLDTAADAADAVGPPLYEE